MTTPPRSQFSLNGISTALDPRIHAVRGDLADIALAGQIFVPHYASPIAMRCTQPTAVVRDANSADSRQISELIFGETFLVLDQSGDSCWGYCQHDHYVGYVAQSALEVTLTNQQESIITVREALVFDSPGGQPNGKRLPMGAHLPAPLGGDFVETDFGFVSVDVLDGHFTDAASVAETLLDVPYLWGGRTALGIDCSGLVQISLALSGGPSAPRDSDQQQSAVGIALPPGAALERNDVIFFPGHVGLMQDEKTLLHATMYHKKTVAEPLADVVARFAKENDVPVLARKRFS